MFPDCCCWYRTSTSDAFETDLISLFLFYFDLSSLEGDGTTPSLAGGQGSPCPCQPERGARVPWLRLQQGWEMAEMYLTGQEINI